MGGLAELVRKRVVSLHVHFARTGQESRPE